MSALARAEGNLRRRRLVNRLVEVTSWAAAVLAVAVLALVVASVAVKGLSSISWDFLTKNTLAFGAGGGIGNAIVGTAILVGLATLMAVPVGILVAIYTSEFATARSRSAVRYVLDVLNGVPTIVTGIFVFGLLVAGHQQSGWAGAVGLAIVMLPLVARSAHEVLALVPASLKEAGLALGGSRWRTIVTVIVPTALSGMLTSALLAVARAVGETAPLLFTT
jgi:phosphate transport system permease protein